MAKVKLIVAVVIALVLVSIFLVNREPVTFSFGPLGRVEVSKTVLILVSAALGSVATLVVQWYLKRGRSLAAHARTDSAS